jgi:hypothetical protein
LRRHAAVAESTHALLIGKLETLIKQTTAWSVWLDAFLD